jgi:hypothetical protein
MTPTTEALQTKDDLFFAELKRSGQVTRAAAVAGVDRSHAYKRRDNDESFAAKWDAALETYCDLLEAEAHRRAVMGTDKGVWHQGVQVGTEKQYSDSLLALMLKAKRKREYGDASKVELTGAEGGPVKIDDTPLQSARKIAFALALGMRAAAAPAADDGTDLA